MPTDQKPRVKARPPFPAKAKVELHVRRADVFNPGQLGSPVAKGTVDQNGDVTFENKQIVDGERYWVTDGETAVSATAKPAPESKRPSPPLESLAPGGPDPENVNRIEGPRSTASLKETTPLEGFGHAAIGRQTHADQKAPDEAQPFPRQEDVTGEPQASDTITGEAHPVDPEAPKPKLTQQDVDGPQRSSTEVGEAAPKDDSSRAKQEDASASLKQRSATPSGEVEPKPEQPKVRKKPSAKKKSASKKSKKKSTTRRK